MVKIDINISVTSEEVSEILTNFIASIKTPQAKVSPKRVVPIPKGGLRGRRAGRRQSMKKADLQCKECKTTKSPSWRNKQEDFGPLCNACGVRRIRRLKRERQ